MPSIVGAPVSGVRADRPGLRVEAQVLPRAGTDADAVDGGVEVEAEGGRLQRRIDRNADSRAYPLVCWHADSIAIALPAIPSGKGPAADRVG